jgi:hypothetical protein
MTGYGYYLPTQRQAPETSKHSYSADRITGIQQDILNYLAKYPGGATDLDIQRAFNDQTSTYRTRRAELVKQGKVRDSGHRMVQLASRRVLWKLV